MFPIEWLSTDPVLLRACSDEGRPFSPIRAFRAIDGTPQYDRAAAALGHGETPSDPLALAEVRLWLLKQSDAFTTADDLAPIEPLVL